MTSLRDRKLMNIEICGLDQKIVVQNRGVSRNQFFLDDNSRTSKTSECSAALRASPAQFEVWRACHSRDLNRAAPRGVNNLLQTLCCLPTAFQLPISVLAAIGPSAIAICTCTSYYVGPTTRVVLESYATGSLL